MQRSAEQVFRSCFSVAKGFPGDVFWTLADAGWGACASLARAPKRARLWLAALPDRGLEAMQSAALAAFDRRWPIVTLSSMLISATAVSQISHATPYVKTAAAKAAPMRLAKHVAKHRPRAVAPSALQSRLAQLAAEFDEPVGVAVSDVATGWVASVKGDAAFPQQSVSKLWVAITVMDAIDEGRLKLDQAIVLGPGDRSVFNQPVSYQIGETGYATTIRDLLRRALIQSDNAANDKLMTAVGGPAAILNLLNRKAIAGVKLAEDEKHLQAHIAGLTWSPALAPYGAFDAARARLPKADREAALQAYLDNPYDGASPEGLVNALAALKRGELLSPASTEWILATMAQAKTGPRRLRGGLPADWSIAHKTGTGQDFRGSSIGINDVAVLTAPDGRAYTVAVMMQKTAKPVSERLDFMQAVSKAVVASWKADPRAVIGDDVADVHTTTKAAGG